MKKFFIFAVIALASVHAADLSPVSGLGIPRKSLELCQAAGKSISEKLASRNFQQIQTSCSNTNSDVGEFMPTIQLKSSSKYTIEVEMLGHVDTLEDCQRDLEKLLAKVAGDNMIEAECLSGTETDYTDPRKLKDPKNIQKKFFQAWISKLVPEKQLNEALPQGSAQTTTSSDIKLVLERQQISAFPSADTGQAAL